MKDALNFIDGKAVPARSGATFPTLDPATGLELARVADSGPEDVDDAVRSARAAFDGPWSKTTAAERSRLLYRLADLIEANAASLARLESQDAGKPITLASTVDIPRAVSNFRFFAGAILHTQTPCHAVDGSALNYTVREPVGVAGLITPWNLPLYLLTWKVAPALAAGNTVVAKPSELTPLTAFALAELAIEAGIPAGVLNLVMGTGARAGAALVAHRDVPLISFTGGTVTGTHVNREAAGQFKKVSLELGGKNPNVIFADCDFDEALETTVRSSFANQGQICLCGSRILVERPIYERFTAALAARARALKIGDPADPATQVGALVSEAHRAKVEGYIEIARREGRIVAGGERPTDLPARVANGAYLKPTVITDLPADSRCLSEEIFGPVVSITPFDTDAEAARLANSTAYGLSATIWTRDLSRAHKMAAAIQSGIVWVNTWLNRDLRTPFGGMKQSGVGREGGEWSLEFYTRTKNVCVKL